MLRYLVPSSFDLREPLALARFMLRWIALGTLVGIGAGAASALFLRLLGWATATRETTPALILLLPAAGFALAGVYARYGGAARRGTALVVGATHTPAEIPARMLPMVLFGTVLSHLFGASVGREGTAVQMGGAWADTLRRVLRLEEDDQRRMVMAGVSGGFGAVFGTPIAGFAFALEVAQIGRVRYEAVVPCLTAALVGDWTARVLGAAHSAYPLMPATPLDPLRVLQVFALGIACGAAAWVFSAFTRAVRRLVTRITGRASLQAAIGGAVIVALALLLGTTEYLGLSLSLIGRSLHGEPISAAAFALKIAFTGIALGTGFIGGEVTPLFVIGSTLGAAASGLLGVEPGWLAAVGFVAVFAGASNTPLACTLMGVELFGGGAMPYLAIGCFTAYLVSGHRGIYSTQQIAAGKFPASGAAAGGQAAPAP